MKHNLKELNDRFKKYFDTAFNPFLDTIMYSVNNEISIDVLKFDDYLKAKYPDYADNISAANFIISKFDQEAHDLVESLL